MSNENWQKGYKEIKNVIHNDIGLTKEEIKDVFREIAKEEIQGIVENNKPFIYATIKEVIESQMISAVSEHRYPKIHGNLHVYGNHGRGQNSFKDYISGVMKEEILNRLDEQFTVNVDIDKK